MWQQVTWGYIFTAQIRLLFDAAADELSAKPTYGYAA